MLISFLVRSKGNQGENVNEYFTEPWFIAGTMGSCPMVTRAEGGASMCCRGEPRQTA